MIKPPDGLSSMILKREHIFHSWCFSAEVLWRGNIQGWQWSQVRAPYFIGWTDVFMTLFTFCIINNFFSYSCVVTEATYLWVLVNQDGSNRVRQSIHDVQQSNCVPTSYDFMKIGFRSTHDDPLRHIFRLCSN